MSLYRTLGSWLSPALTATLALFALPALAQTDVELCERLYVELGARNFQELSRSLDSSLDKLPPEKAEEVRQVVDSLLFVDYKDSSPHLMRSLVDGKPLTGRRIQFLYDQAPGLYDDAASGALRDGEFKNFQEAREYLRGLKREVTAEDLQLVNSIIRKTPGQRVSSAGPMPFRDIAVIGRVPPEKSIAEAQIEAINRNPYLLFEAEPPTRGLKPGTQTGRIWYPNPLSLKEEVYERLQGDPQLVKELRVLKALGATPPEGIRARLEEALIKERLSSFARQRKDIGPLTSPEKLERYIKLAADLQRDLISIHGFSDGNGRTSRAYLYHLLEKEGIPPPRFLDPDDDILLTPEAWREKVLQGVVSTQRLYEDLAERAAAGLPLEGSPELLAPAIPRTVALSFKKQGTKTVIESQRDADIDSRQFAAWVKEKVKAEPGVRDDFAYSPIETSKRLTNEFREFNRSHRLDFQHKKEGTIEVSLNFIDDDFKALFANRSYRQPGAWKRKMDAWYSDQVVWRGISYRHEEVTETEILGMFNKLHPQMLSNEVARTTRASDQDGIVSAVMKDFDRYNSDLYNDMLYKMAKDHSDSGPMYATSYGYSTSRRREVGKAFSMGAMVIAPYGKHQDYQHLLKSRILVGAYRGKKDVDLARFYHLDSRFLYGYPRQAEVMGIGAADPDSVMIVQQLNAKGAVDVSYVRSIDKPEIVWAVKGEYEPKLGEIPPADRLIREFKLD